MTIDITSFFFNSSIAEATATSAWGTSIGQSKSKNCRIEDEKPGVLEILTGMLYKSVADKSRVDLSAGSQSREILLCALFDKVFINNMPLEEALDIVNEFKHDKNKIDFIKELLAEILLYTDYGALHKYETSDYLDEEGNYDNEYDLIETFRDEWRYIYLRLRELIAVINEDDFTAELISWRCVRMHYEDWVVLEERPNNHR